MPSSTSRARCGCCRGPTGGWRCRSWSGSGSTSGWSAWTIPRVGKASKDFSDARSAITGRIVDSYTNIQSVKLFAHTRSEEDYAGEAIEHARKTFMAQMRVITLMDLGLTVINGFLIVAVIGLALMLWGEGRRRSARSRPPRRWCCG